MRSQSPLDITYFISTRLFEDSVDKLKSGILAAAGLVVGVVTLRAVRKQRTSPRDEAEAAAWEALVETKAAAHHAAIAAGHTRVTGEKTVEYAREELGSVSPETSEEGTGLAAPRRRLRKVGKGWLRR